MRALPDNDQVDAQAELEARRQELQRTIARGLANATAADSPIALLRASRVILNAADKLSSVALELREATQ